MKIGISSACFSNQAATEEAFWLVKSAGADCCELCLQTFYEYRPEFAEKFSARTDGLQICSVRVSPDNFERQLFSQSRRIRGDGFYWLDQVMRSAQLFGAKNYIFRGGGFGNPDNAAELLQNVSQFCAGYGVTVGVEACDNPYTFQKLKSRFTQPSAAFDLATARASCYPYGMYINAMQGAILQARVSDFDSNGNACLPGKGVCDFAEVFKRLKLAGFDGTVVIATECVNDITELKSSVELLKRLVSGV